MPGQRLRKTAQNYILSKCSRPTTNLGEQVSPPCHFLNDLLTLETVDVLDWLGLLETELELLPESELDTDEEPDSLGDIELDAVLESDIELIDENEAEDVTDAE